MLFSNFVRAAGALALVPLALGSAVEKIERDLEARGQTPLTVRIGSVSDYCMVVPKNAHTNIGDSEYPGGMTVWCSSGAKSKASSTGTFKGSFWKKGQVALVKTANSIQLTGCVNVGSSDRLNKNDGGGQYDSSGGYNGQGNPQGSKCTGYAHYVELIEPDSNRACIKCCQNNNDCPTWKDTAGCPSVIPGKYFTCG